VRPADRCDVIEFEASGADFLGLRGNLTTPRGSGGDSAVQVLRDLRCDEDVVARVLELPAQVVQIDVEQLPFHIAHPAADDHRLALVRSISETTAPGTLLSGATLMAVASRMMMSASLPG